MKAYRKRAKGSWNVGKGHKHEEGAERQFSRAEIKAQLEADEEDFLEKHRKAPKRNQRARLEYRVKWYEDMIAKYPNAPDYWMRDGLNRAKKELAKLDAKKEPE